MTKENSRMIHSIFAQQVAKLCAEHYSKKLSKNGKPQRGREWTLMSAIVMASETEGMSVVAMGTGSKCIGRSKMCDRGCVLNDSHAEVLTRRSFLR